MNPSKTPSLTTGEKSDPSLPQLLDAINQATEIDIIAAFILQSGLDLIFDVLKDTMELYHRLIGLTGDASNLWIGPLSGHLPCFWLLSV